jgi:hypothetical protein
LTFRVPHRLGDAVRHAILDVNLRVSTQAHLPRALTDHAALSSGVPAAEEWLWFGTPTIAYVGLAYLDASRAHVHIPPMARETVIANEVLAAWPSGPLPARLAGVWIERKRGAAVTGSDPAGG